MGSVADAGEADAPAPTIPDVPLLYRSVIRTFERRFLLGRLSFRLPGGYAGELVGRRSGPEARIVLHRWRAMRRLLFGGKLGFAEAYLRGDWHSPDLAAFVQLMAANGLAQEQQGASLRWSRWTDRLRHLLRPNSKAGSRKNIAFHYDLGNDFYSLWLDPSMTYSSAVFPQRDVDLRRAQRQKNDRILDLLAARPGDHVLEIGCGWGGFAQQAAERGLRVTGITISRQQHEFARRRIHDAGLAERVNIELCDYRDVTGSFDHAASIEMIEAVGEKYWPSYFGKIAEVVRPGGRIAIQAITVRDEGFANYRRRADFIQTYIFPGGMLLCLQALQDVTARVGLRWLGDDGFGQDYAHTLAQWRRNFLDAWPRIRHLGFDDRFRRIWEFYLAGCEGSFRAGGIDVRQIALVKP
ncbi:MAG: class I SAM-dependent methyltransferase [Alphaproteobacteria bacterium]|nr:class I SAM-dependent methyltransferase [Alphaproteobacteria bacterium]